MIDVLFLSPAQFWCKPQVGTPHQEPWSDFVEYLSSPVYADDKAAVGGFCFGRYRGNVRRKSELEAIGVLVVDVDGRGDIARVADVTSAYSTAILETFSSTVDEPRCRLFIELARDVDWRTYERAHLLVRDVLKRVAGVITDDGAKDACRFSYAPVRPVGAPYGFHVGTGAPLDAEALVRAYPEPARPRPVVRTGNLTCYRRQALLRAAEAVVSATAGARHDTLNREVYSLARLGLTEDEIRGALLESAVSAMGEGRRREVERTVRDAFAARRSA